MATDEAFGPLSELSDEKDESKRKSYWSNLVNYYEKKNASLEKKHDALAERIRMMELALPSVLMGAVMFPNTLSTTENNESIKLTKGNCHFCVLANSFCSHNVEMETNKNDEVLIRNSYENKEESEVTH